ncbi:MAG: hypothetical protein ACLPYW_06710 [Acidimicrobiales bacterium]
MLTLTQRTKQAVQRVESGFSELGAQLGVGNGTRIETHPVDVGVHLTQVSSTASNVAGLERDSK